MALLLSDQNMYKRLLFPIHVHMCKFGAVSLAITCRALCKICLLCPAKCRMLIVSVKTWLKRNKVKNLDPLRGAEQLRKLALSFSEKVTKSVYLLHHSLAYN